MQPTRAARSIPACAGEPLPSGRLGKRQRVYPRVCGGTPGNSLTATSISGLSPRVRGNRLPGRSSFPPHRSIPACAGEPGLPLSRHTIARVYPRVCGGTVDAADIRRGAAGLSPRVRGNQLTTTVDTFYIRSIPACAGEPPSASLDWQWTAVYPRVCGGTIELIRDGVLCPGLSPRVRGNLVVLLGEMAEKGSIPACAGEPGGPSVNSSPPTVYPRVCGGTMVILVVDNL